MTYSLLALAFLVVAAGAAFALRARRNAQPDTGATWLCVGALLVLTVVFDSVMIAVGFFTYTDDHLLPVRIGLAPVEDLAYPVAGAILLPAVWVAVRAARGSRTRDDRTEEAA